MSCQPRLYLTPTKLCPPGKSQWATTGPITALLPQVYPNNRLQNKCLVHFWVAQMLLSMFELAAKSTVLATHDDPLEHLGQPSLGHRLVTMKTHINPWGAV